MENNDALESVKRKLENMLVRQHQTNKLVKEAFQEHYQVLKEIRQLFDQDEIDGEESAQFIDRKIVEAIGRLNQYNSVQRVS